MCSVVQYVFIIPLQTDMYILLNNLVVNNSNTNQNSGLFTTRNQNFVLQIVEYTQNSVLPES